MEYSECLPARLNPLAERACFSQVGDGTTRLVCAHPLEAIEDVTVVDNTATFSIDPDSDPWGPDSIDKYAAKSLANNCLCTLSVVPSELTAFVVPSEFAIVGVPSDSASSIASSPSILLMQ